MILGQSIQSSNRRASWLRRVAVVWTVTLVMLVASVASASNYYLVDLERFDEAQVKLFDDAGIKTTEQFLAQALTDRARKALAPKVQMSATDLAEFARDCEFMQISGVGPKATKLLRSSGVASVEALSKADAATLLEKIKSVNAAEKITETNPTLSVVTYWIEHAAKVPYQVK